jgi:hypothetical protein
MTDILNRLFSSTSRYQISFRKYYILLTSSFTRIRFRGHLSLFYGKTIEIQVAIGRRIILGLP